MTVAELINKLSEYPGDMVVSVEVVSAYGAHSWEAQNVEKAEVENRVWQVFIS